MRSLASSDQPTPEEDVIAVARSEIERLRSIISQKRIDLKTFEVNRALARLKERADLIQATISTEVQPETITLAPSVTSLLGGVITTGGGVAPVPPPPTAGLRIAVTDADTGSPIAGATVTLDPNVRDLIVQSTTNTDGTADFIAAFTGGHEIKIKASGYTTLDTSLQHADAAETLPFQIHKVMVMVPPIPPLTPPPTPPQVPPTTAPSGMLFYYWTFAYPASDLSNLIGSNAAPVHFLPGAPQGTKYLGTFTTYELAIAAAHTAGLYTPPTTTVQPPSPPPETFVPSPAQAAREAASEARG